MTRLRELVIDVALVLGCVFGLPGAALATLIAGNLACTGAEPLIGRRPPGRGGQHAVEVLR